MKKSIALTLMGVLTFQLGIPITYALAIDTRDLSPTLIAGRGGGGTARGGGGGGGARPARSGGGGGGAKPTRSVDRSGGAKPARSVDRSGGAKPTRSVDRSGDRANRSANRSGEGINRANLGTSGSGRINRDTVNRADRTVNRDNRNQITERSRNVDRNLGNNNRDLGLNSDRTYSNRVNRDINVDRGNRNVIVNPRGGYGNWGWNRGVAWTPNYGYYGGGFWGALAVSTVAAGVTAAAINAANDPSYVVIQQDSPGYNLFSSYGLTQVRCIEDGSQVYVYGPQDSLICAMPNNLIQAGYYEVDPTDLTLVLR